LTDGPFLTFTITLIGVILTSLEQQSQGHVFDFKMFQFHIIT